MNENLNSPVRYLFFLILILLINVAGTITKATTHHLPPLFPDEKERLSVYSLKEKKEIIWQGCSPTKAQTHSLAQALRHPASEIDTVFLSELDWDKAEFGRVVKSFNPLKLTDITIDDFSAFPLEEFCLFLRGNTVLKRFSINNIPLTPEELAQLAEASNDGSSIREVSLASTGISPAHMPAVNRFLDLPNLRYLDLEDNVIKEGALTLADGLRKKQTPSLAHLLVSKNEIRRKYIKILKRVIEDNNKNKERMNKLQLYGGYVQGKGSFLIIDEDCDSEEEASGEYCEMIENSSSDPHSLKDISYESDRSYEDSRPTKKSKSDY